MKTRPTLSRMMAMVLLDDPVLMPDYAPNPHYGCGRHVISGGASVKPDPFLVGEPHAGGFVI
jgi:hypothetical protein